MKVGHYNKLNLLLDNKTYEAQEKQHNINNFNIFYLYVEPSLHGVLL